MPLPPTVIHTMISFYQYLILYQKYIVCSFTTDLVKCYSPTFPPIDDNKSKQLVIGNCKRYLFNQILLHKPKVLICNGTDVCNMMMSFFPPDSQEPHTLLTSYKTSFQNHAFTLVLSGFIGRIDDRNKRRLGKEIEAILQEENIQL